MQEFQISTMPRHERVLTNLSMKISAGSELRRPEQLAAMSAAGTATREYYGPGIDNMEVHQPELPENVKGVLASYIS